MQSTKISSDEVALFVYFSLQTQRSKYEIFNRVKSFP